MSPIAFHRKIENPVRWNRPYLSYVTQPVSPGNVDYNGSASLTGVATALPYSVGMGTIGYEWKNDSNTIVGVGTELNLTNLTSSVDITQFAIYYPDPSRTGPNYEPNAPNSPLTSNTVTITVLGELTFIQQPDGVET
jgi:hypothetical protein